MYKLIFEVIKQPLGLPIHWLYEYIILFVINEIAFQVAWNISPGGRYGSEIHWLVKIPTFLIIWLVLYVVIVVVKWIIAHWILVTSVLLGVIVLSIITVVLIRRYRTSNS